MKNIHTYLNISVIRKKQREKEEKKERERKFNLI